MLTIGIVLAILLTLAVMLTLTSMVARRTDTELITLSASITAWFGSSLICLTFSPWYAILAAVILFVIAAFLLFVVMKF